MRKAAAFLAAILLVAPMTASASSPGVYAGVEQDAFADWLIFQDRDSAIFFFGIGFRGTDMGGLGTFGGVGKGKCTVSRGRNFTAVMCVGVARVKEIPLEDFEFDPLLSSAHLSVSSGGHDHEIEWVGRGDPQVGQSIDGGPAGVYANAGAARWARATGHLFGRHFTGGGHHSFAFLIEGAFTAVMVAGSRTIEFTDDGRVIVRAMYRLRST